MSVVRSDAQQPGVTSPRARPAASAALTSEPLLHAGFALVGAVPMVVVGLRMIQRSRAEESVAGF